MRTRRLTTVLLLAVFCLLSGLPALASPNAERQTPEATMSLFWQLFKRREQVRLDMIGIDGLSLGTAAEAIRKDVPPNTEYWHDIYRTEISGDQASVWVALTTGSAYRFDLIRIKDEWTISALANARQFSTDAARLDLEIRPDSQRTQGRVVLTVTPERQNLTVMQLRLASELAIDSLTVNDESVEFTRYPNTDLLTIATPRMSLGQTAEVAVSFAGVVNRKDAVHGRQSDIVGRDGTYLSLPLGLAEAAVVDAYVTVPAGQVAALGGELVERLNLSDGRLTYHYRQTGRAGGLAVNTYRTVDAEIGKITARFNILPQHSDSETVLVDTVSDAIAFFTDRLGAFPHADLTVTELPLAHGGAASTPSHIMLAPGLTSAAETPIWTNLVNRETARQWTALLGAESHPWCSSALAIYLGDLCSQSMDGPDAYRKIMDDHHASGMAIRKSTAVGSDGSRILVQTGTRILDAVDPQTQADFYEVVYHRGALVHNLIRYRIGDDAFWKVIREFLTRYGGKSVSPKDYLQLIQEMTGQDLSGVYNSYLAALPSVDLSLDSFVVLKGTAGDHFTMTIRNNGQVMVPFVDVLIEGGPTPVTRRVVLEGAATNVALAGTAKKVRLDPEGMWLDANPGNNWAGTGLLDRGSPTRGLFITAVSAIAITVSVSLLIRLWRRLGWRGMKTAINEFIGPSDDTLMQHGLLGFDPDKVKRADLEGLPASQQVQIDNRAKWHDGIRTVLATDVGSTTTKAILWRLDDSGEFRLTARAEAPTTVEAPWENVVFGVSNAVEKVEKAVGIRIMSGGRIISPPIDGVGVDIYISTSSAGGGLQMVVVGVAQIMTAESANRAATAAGGVVTEVLAIDDGRTVIDRVKRLRELRPDIILLSGGTDGGNVAHVVNLVEQVAVAAPQTRFGHTRTPLVYAGNALARPHVQRLLSDVTSLHIVPNIRPILEQENLEPAREMVHQLFMEHVMSQAPGYSDLLAWVDQALLPTPGAVGRAIEAFGRKYSINVIGMDIGGATTDVFSLIDGGFRRTVSANLGMSYSVPNVLAEAGVTDVARWLPFAIDAEDLQDWAANKMVRPTTLPQTMKDLLIEQAIAREALRLSLIQHIGGLQELRGIQKRRDFGDIFNQRESQSTFRSLNIDAVIGSGGVLSHAPLRAQTLMMIIDSIQPEGITEVFVDRIFMSPQLGLLSTFNPTVAAQILERDGLELLATCIAPVGAPASPGTRLASVTYGTGAASLETFVIAGDLTRVDIPAGVEFEVTIQPSPEYDCGAGPGQTVVVQIEPGLFGLVLDGRGRPIIFPAEPARRPAQMRAWLNSLQALQTQPRRQVLRH